MGGLHDETGQHLRSFSKGWCYLAGSGRVGGDDSDMGKLVDVLAKIYDRQVLNYNALIQLENHLNDSLGLIGTNVYAINDFAI